MLGYNGVAPEPFGAHQADGPIWRPVLAVALTLGVLAGALAILAVFVVPAAGAAGGCGGG